MYRIAIEKLLKWKESKRRKPLIIEGARQVGKTWLMKEFGRLYYTDTVYINFDSNSRMAELFASDLDTERLIMGLELYSGQKIDPDHTLLIFDEVQEVPRALSSLKYFYENAHCMRGFSAGYCSARRHLFSSGKGGLSEAVPALVQGIFDGHRKGAFRGTAQQVGSSNDHEL